MAKYGGAFVYSTAKYGTGDPGPQPVATGALVKWVIMIDWTGSGFTGVNEAQYCVGMTVKRGREFYIAAKANDIEAMRVWPSTMVMDNATGRYDPYNMDSPLYPNVKPGRRVKIQVIEVANGTVHDVLTGHIADIQPESGNEHQVTITINDGLQWLNDQMVSLPMVLHSTISTAITSILGYANYPFGRDVNAWAQPIPVFDAAQYNAADTVNALASGSLGTFFIAADGTAKYYPLSYAGQPSHALDQAVLLKEIKLATPWENIRNVIKVNALRRGQYPPAVIYSSGAMSIASRTISTTNITYPASLGVHSGAPNYDYRANTASDGSGTDITGSCYVGLSNITSTSATLYVYNSTFATMYVTFLQIWGSTFVDQKEFTTSTDSSSVSTYGPRRFELANPWLQDTGYARAFAVLLKDFCSQSQTNPVVRMEARETVQYGIELMDTIALTISKLGVNSSFRVGGIEHEWLAGNGGVKNGQSVLTTLYLQKVIYSAVAITPDPFYPPAIPPVVPPYPSPTPSPAPIPTPTPPPGDTTCQTDMAAPITGPFSLALGGDLYSVTVPSATANYACIIRSASASNLSAISINGTFEYTDDGGATWKPLLDNSAIVIDALDGSNAIVCTAVMAAVVDAGTGTRTGTFSPVGASSVAKFRISVAGSDVFYYIYGAPINSGPLTVTAESGLELLDSGGYHLAGGLYAVQGKAATGPWFYAPGLSRYGIQEGVYSPSGSVNVNCTGNLDDAPAYMHGTSGNPASYDVYNVGYNSHYIWADFTTGSQCPAGTVISVSGSDLSLYGWLSIDGSYIGKSNNFPWTALAPFTTARIGTDYEITDTGTITFTLPATTVWDDGLKLDTAVVVPRTRIYFSAASVPGKDYVRVLDTPGSFGNNYGAMDYELYHAGSAGTVHLAINSVLLYNVCPPV